ncbi:hypothetical protein TVAG_178230 [Trichomonas vaginalis G3]|uniref:Uncharacterized protein n=1 Tax=Trichomonas vaginalis (strain ATCC PRA-98 / G3) TaxID=412133 RepID=A2DIH5_TRIV3|nr:A-type inclusion protein-related family [Trichomonas vaginalis G3]EAY19779.1 hypothetical protein TVAG_178230 [Trichomonas vaginalis G3]KAI5523906.1 A-type inclusion protein-related family [Trichomonas vaginalis G3]|eukprot:XP_001580765.1 hypothetical protein [Trichomonas vaginalis G3]
MSTCSSNWSNSQGSHTKGDLLQIQEMKLQNEHLQARIEQLQNSLDTTNSQLRQALETASTVNPLHEENIALKLQLREATDNYTKTKNSFICQLAELNQKLDDEKSKNAKAVEEQAKEITKLKNYSNKTQKERDLVTDELITYKEQLADATTKVQKLVKHKAKARSMIDMLSNKIDQLESVTNELSTENDKLTAAKRSLETENAQLKDQIENLKQSDKHNTDTLHYAQTENKNLCSAIESLQEQFEIQKDDFTSIAEERDSLLQIIKKLHSAICYYENELDSLKQQNALLQDKSKKAAVKPQLFSDQFDITQITFPFDDDLKKQINTIIGFDHFQPMQKLQLIINEITKSLNNLQQKAKESTQNAETFENDNKILKENYNKSNILLSTLAREWKNLECNEEKIDAIEFCENDKNFLEFLAEEIPKIKELPEDAQNLLAEESANLRHEILENLSKKDKVYANLVSVVFLDNQRLRKQLEKVLASCNKKEQLMQTLESVGVEDVYDLPEIIKELQSQIDHLKDTRRELHVALVEARNALKERVTNDEQMQNQLNENKQKLSELYAENQRLKCEFERLHNNTSITMPIIPQTPTTKPVQIEPKYVKEENDDDELKLTLKNLHDTIKSKTEEIEKLKKTLKELTEEANLAKDDFKRHLKRKENEIQNLEMCLQKVTENLQKSKKKLKIEKQKIYNEHQNEVNQIVMNFEKAKQELNQSLTENKEKVEKLSSANSKIQNDLQAKQDESKSLKDENNSLITKVQNLENKLQLMNDQIAKEQKQNQANTTVKLLNQENLHQKETKELRMKYESEKKRMMDFITSHLGSLYGIIDFDYDENSISQLFIKIQNDLNKLKYFQDQATKL